MIVAVDSAVLKIAILSLSFSVITECQDSAVSSVVATGGRRLRSTAFDDDVGTWAIDDQGNVIAHSNQRWIAAGKHMRHVTVGPTGVWALDHQGNIFYRQGVSHYRPQGAQWTRVKGSMQVLTAGIDGTLYGIDKSSRLHCRYGFTCTNPLGTTWLPVLPKESPKGVSCGARGCWIVTAKGDVTFFAPSSRDKCQPGQATLIPSTEKAGQSLVMSSVSTSPSGWRVVGVTTNGSLYKREGLSGAQPQGTGWRLVSHGQFVQSVPCHMGYIAVQSNGDALFITNVPKCQDSGARLTDVDTGDKIIRPSTWGTKGGNVYSQQGDTWVSVPGPAIARISTSGRDVWATGRSGEVFYRQGVNCHNPYGDTWERVQGTLKQVDSGKFGLVYGVDHEGRVYCRAGISSTMRTGITWIAFDGNMTYTSCGDFGCWAISHDNEVYFRRGVETNQCAGVDWELVPGPSPMKIVEAGHHGLVFALDVRGRVYARVATSELDPIGTGWLELYNFKRFIDVSHAQLRIMLIDINRVTYVCG